MPWLKARSFQSLSLLKRKTEKILTTRSERFEIKHLFLIVGSILVLGWIDVMCAPHTVQPEAWTYKNSCKPGEIKLPDGDYVCICN